MSISFSNTVIIDSGHLNCRVGVSTDDKPKVFPSIVSIPNKEVSIKLIYSSRLVGI